MFLGGLLLSEGSRSEREGTLCVGGLEGVEGGRTVVRM